MNDVVYQVEYSVEAPVSPAFAWGWRTDVKNWDDPPAQFQLDGSFATGSWGTTLLPGQEPMRWHIRDLRPGSSFVIEMPLDGTTLSFEWHRPIGHPHETLPAHRPRRRQRRGVWADPQMEAIADGLVYAESYINCRPLENHESRYDDGDVASRRGCEHVWVA